MHLVGFIIRIYRNARSFDCQKEQIGTKAMEESDLFDVSSYFVSMCFFSR